MADYDENDPFGDLPWTWPTDGLYDFDQEEEPEPQAQSATQGHQPPGNEGGPNVAAAGDHQQAQETAETIQQLENDDLPMEKGILKRGSISEVGSNKRLAVEQSGSQVVPSQPQAAGPTGAGPSFAPVFSTQATVPTRDGSSFPPVPSTQASLSSQTGLPLPRPQAQNAVQQELPRQMGAQHQAYHQGNASFIPHVDAATGSGTASDPVTFSGPLVAAPTVPTSSAQAQITASQQSSAFQQDSIDNLFQYPYFSFSHYFNGPLVAAPAVPTYSAQAQITASQQGSIDNSITRHPLFAFPAIRALHFLSQGQNLRYRPVFSNLDFDARSFTVSFAPCPLRLRFSLKARKNGLRELEVEGSRDPELALQRFDGPDGIHDRPDVCPKGCGQQYVLMDQHIAEAHRNRAYPCWFCNCSFDTPSRRESHRERCAMIVERVVISPAQQSWKAEYIWSRTAPPGSYTASDTLTKADKDRWMMELVIKSVDGFLAGYVKNVELKFPTGRKSPPTLHVFVQERSKVIISWLNRCWIEFGATAKGFNCL
ncbi:hypothetical protein BJ508DRAFT_27968 [Ascobolus immersus RN42]|uniref:Uncharacterized protein n=1 Tax=Ascobolus immersus RN42 TaxID=1160509 RepID=A0A3N4HNV4_ASCIM|nr:hypothetical protein BJ508DRAFT_27968 [Ascobolus immersus RN42]